MIAGAPPATWLVVGACAVACGASLLAGAIARRTERRPWLLAAVVQAWFALHKAFALQSLLVARMDNAARNGGWYEARRGPQLIAVALLVAAAVLLSAWLAGATRSSPGVARGALGASALLVLYALLGMVSLHGWDRLVSGEAAGVRFYTLIELALPLAVTACAARSMSHRAR